MIRGTRARALALALAALGVSFGPWEATALAQGDAEIALAKQFFRDGEAAEKKQDYPKALALFEKALAIKQTPQIFLRVAAIDERLGKLVEALVAYERAQERATSAQLSDVAMVAKEGADAVRARVPSVTVSPVEVYDGLAVTLDGSPLSPATFGNKLPVNAGEHTLKASAPGHEAFEKTFTIAEKEAKDLAVTLTATTSGPIKPATSPAAAPSVAPDQPPRPRSKAPYVLLGGGVAGVAAGVAFFVVAAKTDSDVDTLCGGADRLRCPQSKEDAINADVSRVNAFRAVSLALGGLGLVSAGVGTYMLLSRPKEKRVTWMIAPDGDGRGSFGLSAAGRF